MKLIILVWSCDIFSKCVCKKIINSVITNPRYISANLFSNEDIIWSIKDVGLLTNTKKYVEVTYEKKWKSELENGYLQTDSWNSWRHIMRKEDWAKLTLRGLKENKRISKNENKLLNKVAWMDCRKRAMDYTEGLNVTWNHKGKNS